LKPANRDPSASGGDGSGSLLPGGSSGGGGPLDLLSIIPSPFGPLQGAQQGNAPGQFMPTMPGADSGGILGRAFAPPGAAGPGNQPIDNSIHINNPVGQDHLRSTFDQAQQESMSRARQPLRHVPSG
jgi:hypothetical protein